MIHWRISILLTTVLQACRSCDALHHWDARFEGRRLEVNKWYAEIMAVVKSISKEKIVIWFCELPSCSGGNLWGHSGVMAVAAGVHCNQAESRGLWDINQLCELPLHAAGWWTHTQQKYAITHLSRYQTLSSGCSCPHTDTEHHALC